MYGQNRLATFFSQRIPLEYQNELDKAWEAWDEEVKWYKSQEDIWENQLPNRNERIQGFLDDGSLTQEDIDEFKKRFLLEKHKKLMKLYLKNKDKNVLKELNKVRVEYKYRFEKEKNDRISDRDIEVARETPLSNFVEVKNGFALCPFHNDKTPSLKIDKNLFYCFACNEGGDTIKFIMKTKDMKFPTAIKYILNN